MSAASLTIDHEARIVRRDGCEVYLRNMEMRLMLWFDLHAGKAVTREDILREVWGFDCGSTGTIDAHVLRLRHKLGASIETLRGFGYRYNRDAR